MTTLQRVEPAVPTRPSSAKMVWIAVGALLVVGIALMLPNVAGGDVGSMTHYMGLLAANQPWNLILFMAVPVILAESLAITELVVLFTQGRARRGCAA